ncbi:MAG TPA: FtsX-like permease family protein [Bacteroides sp.]|nr:FtsX-like permease family protein [Bacteroides sp.]
MFKNFIKIAIRSILRQKIYSLINILGLAVGLASSILISLFIIHELSYDRFHTKSDQIQRLCVKGRIGEQDMNMAFTAMPTAEAFTREFPEIIGSCRIDNRDNVYFRYGETKFIEDNMMWVDSSFFNMFDFKLISGQPDRVLTEPNSIVLTEDMARKYFGGDDPVGQSIAVFGDSTLYQITGVVENCPENSHMYFNFLASFHTRSDASRTIWMSHNVHTYFLLIPGADTELLTEKIQPVMLKYVGPEVEMYLGVQLDQWTEEGNSYGMYLQPLKEIHLESGIQQTLKEPHEKKYIYIFGLIAIFILTIACINFMNLSTARSSNRAREVGMRKVFGSSKALLASQFLWESIFLVGIAMLTAIVLVSLLLPSFNNLVGLDLSANYPSSYLVIPLLIGLVVIVGLLSGSYPAFYLSSFKPLSVISGELATGMKTGWLRNVLVILQFVISIGIIISTMVVGRQINFMLKKDLGYVKEQMLVIDRIGAVGTDHIQTFKQEVGRLTGVLASSNHTMKMGYTNNSNAYMIEGQPGEQTPVLATNWVDFDYAETYKLEVVLGRFLSADIASDSTNVVVNEAALRAFNLEDPLSIRLIQPAIMDQEKVYHQIVGVVKNFHFESLHEEIQPYIFIHKNTGMNWGGHLTVRLKTDDISSTIKEIENLWLEFSNNQPFEYSFVDKDFEVIYSEEVRTGKIFGVFSLLAILVACLGLLGLSSYSTEQRTREIGIRKAMGADVPAIVRLLSKETIILVLIATVIAVPLSWYFMSNWIEAFAFRITMGPGVFIIPFLGALLVALITVSFQSVSAALKNPADSLRHE